MLSVSGESRLFFQISTRLCEHETNLKVIQAIMGHRNIETTMDIYAEATDQKKQESFENLSKLDIF